MRAAVTIMLAAILAFASADCSKKGAKKGEGRDSTGVSAEARKPGAVLVKVNGKAVTAQDIDRQEKMLVQQFQGRVDSAQFASMMPQIRKQAVENAVNRVLIEQATKKLGLKAPSDQVDSRINEYRKNFVSEEAFTNDLAKNGLTKESLRGEVEFGLEAEELFNRRVSSVKPVTDAEIRAFYDGNPERFQQAEQVKASHILVKVNKEDDAETRALKKEKAQKILSDIKKGADFADQAKRYSDDMNNRERGGDLGYFQRGQMVPEFETAAFGLKVTGVSGVVETPFGFHIIKVTDRKRAQTVPFDQAKQSISAVLSNEKRNQSLLTYLDSLRAASKIEYLDSSLVR